MIVVPAGWRVASASESASGPVSPAPDRALGRVIAREIESAAPANAVPRAEPICRTVLYVADPWPETSTGMSRRTVPVSCAEATPRPRP